MGQSSSVKSSLVLGSPRISGGYILGSISGLGGVLGPSDGNDLIRQAGGKVVVVLIQYRLGVFGFLSGSQVKKQGALNAGLRELISHCTPSYHSSWTSV